MSERRTGGWVAAVAIAVALGAASFVLGIGTPAEDEAKRKTRETMQRMYASVRDLLPLSMDEAGFRDPANRNRVRLSLQTLSENASVLAEHSRTEEAGFAFVGRSLVHGTREIRDLYDRGAFEETRFLLQEITENCIACHAKLPSPTPDTPLSRDFVDQESFSGLSRLARAQILFATRQFDAALETWEETFASAEENPAAMLGPLTDYLVVCLRVKGDFERPVPILLRFTRRPDLWRHLRSDVEFWIASIPRLAERGEPPTVESARTLLDEARGVILFPADRRALVHYVVASGILNRYVESHADDGRDLGEAYYLLGVVESRIGRAYWLGQAGFYLETSIRLAPGEPFAEQAYGLLEEEVVLEYTYNDGVHIPEEVAERLAELRNLIDRQTGTPSP
jgi:tetratricopeptide (TPR) repeat protein